MAHSQYRKETSLFADGNIEIQFKVWESGLPVSTIAAEEVSGTRRLVVGMPHQVDIDNYANHPITLRIYTGPEERPRKTPPVNLTDVEITLAPGERRTLYYSQPFQIFQVSLQQSGKQEKLTYHMVSASQLTLS